MEQTPYKKKHFCFPKGLLSQLNLSILPEEKKKKKPPTKMKKKIVLKKIKKNKQYIYQLNFKGL